MEELNEQIAEALRGLGFAVSTTPDRDAAHAQPGLAVRLPASQGETVAVVDVNHGPHLTSIALEKWRSVHPAGTILGCDYVSPSYAQRLRAAGIDFVDSSGNASISRPGLRVHIEGRRRNRAVAPRKSDTLCPPSARQAFASSSPYLSNPPWPEQLSMTSHRSPA